MNDVAFAAAAKPAPAVILNLKMLDYSIGHEILLQSQGNALLMPGDLFSKLPPDQQRAAVICAAQVCCKTWVQNADPDAWLKRQAPFFFRIWSWAIKHKNFAVEIAEFRNYREAGSLCPRLMPIKDEDGRVPGSDILARLLNFVHLNYDFPLGLAYHLYFAHLEMDGSCHVENDFERRQRHEGDDLEEQIKREQLGRIKPC